MVFAFGAIGILIGLAVLAILLWIFNLLLPILIVVVSGTVIGIVKIYSNIVLWIRELRNDRRDNA
ncbi:hypothetical protein IL308_09655 [Lactococcus lactis]|uniref:Uncharacterized protein n=1 Tax=Lactococcus lactis TaxID=1358 RepID=A0A9X4SA92_9LACT|nr:hypothetical protein [Lactococcus lactis]MBK5077025.1 hypothetical protein [Lactococcus lactis]MDG4957496.1 hypothetical protein [Lactococcus lactis]MDG4984754.1 hypothetical protein [Lactococcus lactis]WDA70008.1 hypothetical protein IL310_08175 [Lactococcus lactis]